MKLPGVFAALTAFLVYSGYPGGEAAAQCAVGSVQFENDLVGAGTDRHYTHGSRVSCISEVQTPLDTAHRLASDLQFSLLGAPVFDARGAVRYSFALGQSMFTPEDTARYGVVGDDRPYAGWLFGTASLVLGPRWQGSNRSAAFDSLETLELTLGVVGPASGVADTQKFVHSTIGSPNPEGWHNQLRNEPGVILGYEHKWRSESWNLLPGSDWLQADVMPAAGFALGNIHTYGTVSATFRFGSNLANDFGPPRIRPSVAGSEYYDPRADETLGAYLFLSVGGRLVGRNIFLDGNTFVDSHHVDKEVLVGDLQFGVVFSLAGAARVALTHIIRTREFEGQDAPDQFSALSLSFAF